MTQESPRAMSTVLSLSDDTKNKILNSRRAKAYLKKCSDNTFEAELLECALYLIYDDWCRNEGNQKSISIDEYALNPDKYRVTRLFKREELTCRIYIFTTLSDEKIKNYLDCDRSRFDFIRKLFHKS